MIDPARHAVMWLLIFFVLTTAATRATTRYIRHKADRAETYIKETQSPGMLRNIIIAGIHIHHQVWGILMVLFSGLLLITYMPGPGLGRNTLAAIFGIGAAWTLDEFAMWLHLDDVYWLEEGRASISALIVAVTITTALMLGSNPFDFVPHDKHWLPGAAIWAIGLLNLAGSVVSILKGKLPVGIIGAFVPLVAWVGAVRLAKPDSPWAKWRYPQDGRRAARARERFGPVYEARWNAVRDFIGGRPYDGEEVRRTIEMQLDDVRRRRRDLPEWASDRAEERAEMRAAAQARAKAKARASQRARARREERNGRRP